MNGTSLKQKKGSRQSNFPPGLSIFWYTFVLLIHFCSLRRAYSSGIYLSVMNYLRAMKQSRRMLVSALGENWAPSGTCTRYSGDPYRRNKWDRGWESEGRKFEMLGMVCMPLRITLTIPTPWSFTLFSWRVHGIRLVPVPDYLCCYNWFYHISRPLGSIGMNHSPHSCLTIGNMGNFSLLCHIFLAWLTCFDDIP